MKRILIGLSILGLAGCGGKYAIKSYPSDAKLYIKDLKSNEKKLIGNTPLQMAEDKKLGDVFFVVLLKRKTTAQKKSCSESTKVKVLNRCRDS
jgi:hypothetical protein